MKKWIMAAAAVVCFVLMIVSLFSGGHIRLFGFPISGGLFYLVARGLLEELRE